MVFGTTYCGISHLPIEDGDPVFCSDQDGKLYEKFRNATKKTEKTK